MAKEKIKKIKDERMKIDDNLLSQTIEAIRFIQESHSLLISVFDYYHGFTLKNINQIINKIEIMSTNQDILKPLKIEKTKVVGINFNDISELVCKEQLENIKEGVEKLTDQKNIFQALKL